MTATLEKILLVAEDSDEDFVVLQRLMKQFQVQTSVYRCVDGDEVLDFLCQEGEYENSPTVPRPAAILLDLNLPGLDGRELLEQLKQDENFKTIPIIIFTTSSNPEDIEWCYQQGANGYLIKPVNALELRKTIRSFVEYWLESNVFACSTS
ncbi:response regulator [Spirulina sp. 06S082]|uniref:response regulator n=1 Tax=Spirulina sp. 06S082 TaxID=3110248 RepID=UPI002B1FF6F9|nr:response regulator [Spirulina sp. 06S082]MEA5471724.1 response regulator [Spirulina sp. 06S082]